jgi:hypothetical protein
MRKGLTFKACLLERLDGPLGPTSLAFALKDCHAIVQSLRQNGASWNQILDPVNAAMRKVGKEQVSVDTLRGMVAREERRIRKKQASKAKLDSSGANPSKAHHPQQARVAGSAAPETKKSMKGESQQPSQGRLEDAAVIAAALELMKDI